MGKLFNKSVVYSFVDGFSKNCPDANSFKVEGLYDFALSADDLKRKLKTGKYENLTVCVDSNTPKDKLLNIINISVKTNVRVDVVNCSGEQSRKMTLESESINPAQFQLGKIFGDVEPEDEKLKIVSRTAATLNHRINNSLLAISANAEMLLKQSEDLDPKFKDRVMIIRQASDHIRDVIENLGNLKKLSYTQTATGQMINLNNIAPQNKERFNSQKYLSN